MTDHSQIRVRATLQLTVYRQSVCPGDKPLRLTTSNFIFQLNTCSYSPYLTSCLTREWVYHLQLLLVLASTVILRFESHRIHDHILLSKIQDSPNLQGGLVIPPGTGLWLITILGLIFTDPSSEVVKNSVLWLVDPAVMYFEIRSVLPHSQWGVY
jgi:hypothetical protein